MSLAGFQKRLKEAQHRSERINKLAEEEDRLKKQIINDSADLADTLKTLGDDLDELRKGGALGPAS